MKKQLALIFYLTLSTSFAQELATELPEKVERPSQEETLKAAGDAYEAAKKSAGATGAIAGMIQYVDGDLEWTAGNHKEEPQFRSFFRSEDKIKLDDDDSLVKIITEQGCIGVVYGPGELTAPSRWGQPWKVNTPSLRWICSKGGAQKVINAGVELDVDEGEFVISEGKLLTHRPLVKAKNNELKTGLLHEKDDSGTWQPLENQPDEYELWELDDELRKPLESFVYARPTHNYKQRIILSFITGVGSFKHNQSEFDEKELDAKGAQIQYQRAWGSKYLTFHLGFFDQEDSERDEENNGGSRPPETRISMERVDLGLRWSAQKTWGFYGRIGYGFGRLESDGNLFDSTGAVAKSFNFESKYNFLILSAGVEKTFFKSTVESWGPLGWHGLYLAIDLQVMTSVSADANRVDEFFIAPGVPPGISEDITEGSVFGASIAVSIGLPFGF